MKKKQQQYLTVFEKIRDHIQNHIIIYLTAVMGTGSVFIVITTTYCVIRMKCSCNRCIQCFRCCRKDRNGRNMQTIQVIRRPDGTVRLPINYRELAEQRISRIETVEPKYFWAL